jgi:hypothetical protein
MLVVLWITKCLQDVVFLDTLGSMNPFCWKWYIKIILFLMYGELLPNLFTWHLKFPGLGKLPCCWLQNLGSVQIWSSEALSTLLNCHRFIYAITIMASIEPFSISATGKISSKIVYEFMLNPLIGNCSESIIMSISPHLVVSLLPLWMAKARLWPVCHFCHLASLPIPVGVESHWYPFYSTKTDVKSFTLHAWRAIPSGNILFLVFLPNARVSYF